MAGRQYPLARRGWCVADLSLDSTNRQGVPVTLSDVSVDKALKTAYPPPVCELVVRDGEVHLIDVDGQTVAVLEPLAAYVEIAEPKNILPDSIPDDLRQYAWAERLEALNKEPRLHSLDLRVRECVVEKKTICSRCTDCGDGGRHPRQGTGMAIASAHLPGGSVVRFQTSWALHWDPKRYALAQAAWIARFSTPFAAAGIPEVTPLFDLTSGAFQLQSEVTAHSQTLHGHTRTASSDWPDTRWHVVLAAMEDDSRSYLAVGAPNFTRLGPNRISVDRHSVMLASWSDHGGQALDCASPPRWMNLRLRKEM